MPDAKTSTNVPSKRARAESAKRQRLQSACFIAWVDGKSYQEIATETGLARHTVSIYVRDEQDQRAVENAGCRALQLERAMTLYQNVINHYFEKMLSPNARGDEGKYICIARRALDALFGLVTQRVAIETPPEAPAAPSVFTKDPAAMLRFAIACDPTKRDQPGSLLPFWDELRAEHLRREREREEGNN